MRPPFLILGFTIILFAFYSCKDKVICPAFQSTYILDDSMRMAYFSPFLGDSLPRETAMVRKSKYGIIKKDPYLIKNYKLKTSPMENVLRPPVEDTTSVETGEFVAEDFVEGDSLLASNKKKEPEEKEEKYKYGYRRDDKFNVDQEYYNKYFGYLFIDDSPDVEPEEEGLSETDSTLSKKRGLKGLFKKKTPEEKAALREQKQKAKKEKQERKNAIVEEEDVELEEELERL
jgi:hypothetical protein